MKANNKLIVEFMGNPTIFNPIHDATLYQVKEQDNMTYHVDELQYHISWDWLMPVVKKIGDDYYNTPFDETYSKLTEQYENIWTLEDTYKAVVEFIKDQNN